MRISIVALALLASPAAALTSDQLSSSPSFNEEFSGNPVAIQARLRSGISPWPDAPITRIHFSGEKGIFSGLTQAGRPYRGIRPTVGFAWGYARLFDRPLTTIERRAVTASARGLTADRRAKIVATTHATALLASKATAKLGRGDVIAARFVTSSQPGRWTSFYLYDWKRKVELDIVEEIGDSERGCYHFTLHSRVAPKQSALVCPGVGQLRAEAHEYGVHYVGNEVRPRFDGKDVPWIVTKVYKDEQLQPLGIPITMPEDFIDADWSWVANETVGGWPELAGYGYDPRSSSQSYWDWVRRTHL